MQSIDRYFVAIMFVPSFKSGQLIAEVDNVVDDEKSRCGRLIGGGDRGVEVPEAWLRFHRGRS